jgi:hypothetical protein
MRAPSTVHAILSLVPGAQVAVRGDAVEWIDPAVAPVTNEQIATELARLTTAHEAAQAMAPFTDAAQRRLDDFAKTRLYDGILSACTYAGSAVPSFQAEGLRAVELRDATWAAAYQILAAVQGGNPTPTIAEFVAQLPELSW